MGEAEVDRDAASFFFRQPVRIDSGKCFDQRTLAMINMAGGREDEMFMIHFLSRRIVVELGAGCADGVDNKIVLVREDGA